MSISPVNPDSEFSYAYYLCLSYADKLSTSFPFVFFTSKLKVASFYVNPFYIILVSQQLLHADVCIEIFAISVSNLQLLVTCS